MLKIFETLVLMLGSVAAAARATTLCYGVIASITPLHVPMQIRPYHHAFTGVPCASGTLFPTPKKDGRYTFQNP